jgi:hypothetical protein
MPKKSFRQKANESNLVAWYKWEFLRRNANYRKDYEAFIGEWGGWFKDHGYWYDQTAEPWGHENLRFFAAEIAPKGKVICERWNIRDPYPPEWVFNSSGAHFYKPGWNVFLPTDCPKEEAGRVWELSDFLLSDEEFNKRLPSSDSRLSGPQPDHDFEMAVDLRLPLAALLRQAKDTIASRKRVYDKHHPKLPKITRAVRLRLDRYDDYLRAWDLRKGGKTFATIGTLLFPGLSTATVSVRFRPC